MATPLKNLSETSLVQDKRFRNYHIAVVVAEWNREITFALRDGVLDFLNKMGLTEKNILVHYVPGAFELPLSSMWCATQKNIDAVIAIGCVIQGETPHFDFISQACANGILQVSLKTKKPVVFGVLTTTNLKQAKERSGGKHGNKGTEAAETVLKMLQLKDTLKTHRKY